jgi:hypothetical protein
MVVLGTMKVIEEDTIFCFVLCTALTSRQDGL